MLRACDMFGIRLKSRERVQRIITLLNRINIAIFGQVMDLGPDRMRSDAISKISETSATP